MSEAADKAINQKFGKIALMVIVVLVPLLATGLVGMTVGQATANAKLVEHERRITKLEDSVYRLPAIDADVQWMRERLGGVPATRP